jgi:hypothetical protein
MNRHFSTMSSPRATTRVNDVYSRDHTHRAIDRFELSTTAKPRTHYHLVLPSTGAIRTVNKHRVSPYPPLSPKRPLSPDPASREDNRSRLIEHDCLLEKIPKPPGEVQVGRSSKGGYDLHSVLQWSDERFHNVQVCKSSLGSSTAANSSDSALLSRWPTRSWIIHVRSQNRTGLRSLKFIAWWVSTLVWSSSIIN